MKSALSEADKAAAVKAVKEAKNQVQLTAALTKFPRVNNDWIVSYATDLVVSNLDKTFDQIQEVIYSVNASSITAADNALTSAGQAKVTSLIEAYAKPDGEKETAKADKIAASKVKESAFTVAEATTPNNLYNALVGYANLVADEKVTATLKVSELNTGLKAFYFAKLNKDALATAIKDGQCCN